MGTIETVTITSEQARHMKNRLLAQRGDLIGSIAGTMHQIKHTAFDTKNGNTLIRHYQNCCHLIGQIDRLIETISFVSTGDHFGNMKMSLPCDWLSTIRPDCRTAGDKAVDAV